MSGVSPIPEGFHSLTPYLIVKNSLSAIKGYETVFGAQLIHRMQGMNGEDSTGHADLKIGDSHLMIADECMDFQSPHTLGGTPVSVFLYVEDVDAIVKKAEAAEGFEVKMEPQDMFWGDRMAKVTDPDGHEWGVATHVEDVSPDEMEKRQVEWVASMNS